MRRLPQWLRQEIPSTLAWASREYLVCRGLATVCQEARCPNLGTCFKRGCLTFLILGPSCTRSCSFCAVEKSAEGKPLDPQVPLKIARAVQELGLNYVVITSVTRDDLADGGAGVFAATTKAVRALNPGVKVELLIPDFRAKPGALKIILAAQPDILGHNLETVKRLYPRLRPQADYSFSLSVLRSLKESSPCLPLKSSLMLGLGEEEAELVESMRDLRSAGCSILCLGQYLSPSPAHYPVREFIQPEQFARYKDIALELGFKTVLSAPLARSSYHAEEVFQEALCTI
jgi:lipoic acid synthetase